MSAMVTSSISAPHAIIQELDVLPEELGRLLFVANVPIT